MRKTVERSKAFVSGSISGGNLIPQISALVKISLANPPHCFIIRPTRVSSVGSIISNSSVLMRGLRLKQQRPMSGPRICRISFPLSVLTEYKGLPYFSNCWTLPKGLVPSVTVICYKGFFSLRNLSIWKFSIKYPNSSADPRNSIDLQDFQETLWFLLFRSKGQGRFGIIHGNVKGLKATVTKACKKVSRFCSQEHPFSVTIQDFVFVECVDENCEIQWRGI